MSGSDRVAQLESTSAILGEYMLRGWALTDLSCDTCAVTPLMREPPAAAGREGRAPIQFCALCDGKPENTALRTPTPSAPAEPLPTPTEAAFGLSTTVSSPFGPVSAVPPAPALSTDTAQADTAASSISALLLQGYALLGDNCPNPSCRGIPLMGYPKRKDGTKDGRRMCVSCGGAWVDEADIGDLKLLPPPAGPSAPARSVPSGQADPESPRDRARRELYEAGERLVAERAAESSAELARTAGRASNTSLNTLDVDMDDPSAIATPVAGANGLGGPSTSDDVAFQSSLRMTLESVTLNLAALARSLRAQAPVVEGPRPDEGFQSIRGHAEAIKDMLDVAAMVERLRR